MSPLISGCLIVKNEEQNLSRCLSSLAPHVDELIVVDTGSNDQTVAIAQSFSAQIFHFDWCDDFSAARNFALAQATGEWILALDADEELVVHQGNWREQLAMNNNCWICSIALSSSDDDLTVMEAQRLFRNSSRLRYFGKYHEHLLLDQATPDSGVIQKNADLSLIHYGYALEVLPQKSKMRIPILENIRQSDGLNFMLLWTLSGMYEVTEDWANVESCYEEAAERLFLALVENEKPSDFRSVPSWLFGLGVKYLKAEDLDSLHLICQRGIEWCPDFPPLFFLTGLLMKLMGFSLAAQAYFQKCLFFDQTGHYSKAEPFDLQLIKAKPHFELGHIALSLSQREEALSHFRDCLKYDPNYSAAENVLQSLMA